MKLETLGARLGVQELPTLKRTQQSGMSSMFMLGVAKLPPWPILSPNKLCRLTPTSGNVRYTNEGAYNLHSRFAANHAWPMGMHGSRLNACRMCEQGVCVCPTLAHPRLPSHVLFPISLLSLGFERVLPSIHKISRYIDVADEGSTIWI